MTNYPQLRKLLRVFTVEAACLLVAIAICLVIAFWK
jgi:hypothetical protein